MPKKSTKELVPDEVVISKILLIRGKKVMIDRDLAELYGVTTFRLNEQVKRNKKRFPEDFMFQVTKDEKQQLIERYANLETLKFSPSLPHVFTEHGAVMLASVLNSDRAIAVNSRYNYTNPNDSVSKVDSTSAGGQKVGPNLLLKVMSGDTVNFSVQCYYVSPGGGSTNNSSFSDVLNSLSNGLVNLTGGAHGNLLNLTGSGSTVYNGLSSFLNGDDTTHTGYPKAYLNWIFLDDQFNYVGSLSGSVLAASSTYPAGTMNQVAPGAPIILNRSGYLYIWVSNETTGWDVYYDNLSIQYKQGPLLEENHYYPYGLTMAGLSDKALKANYAENKYRYNDGAELQNKEFADGTGLETYETNFRGYDPQLGRFGQMDPLEDRFHFISPYQFALNNPTEFNDPTGALTTAEYQEALEEAMQVFYSPNFENGNINMPLVSGGQLNHSNGSDSDGGDDGPAFMPSDLQGYEPVFQVDPLGGVTVIGWQKVLPTATVTPQNNGNNGGMSGWEIAGKTNQYVDQAMVLTDANIRGVQKLANVVSKTSNEITILSKIPVLNVVAKATGVATIVTNSIEARDAWNQGNKGKAIWKGTEAVATTLFLIFGGEELELAWNLGTMAVDGVSALVHKD